jgi:hypothetical protein
MTRYEINKVVDKVVNTPLRDVSVPFGLDERDHKELCSDSISCAADARAEKIQSYTFKAVITAIVGGMVGALWLGIKTMMGK